MPIYEYVCEDCQTRYERIVLSKDQAIACPKCASKRHTLQLSVFSKPGRSNGGSEGSSPSGGACGCTPRSCSCN